MKLSEAVALRIRQILNDRNMTQYRLEMSAGITHGTMNCLLNARYKGCNLTTLFIIIKTLGLTVAEFFDDPIFEDENLIVE